ncbi:nuclease-related domain-containing protein [Sulfuriroseicoccus oceanibius]|uniref:NERD domain-containing protein n=1 Tax=Sulfuriroseicoccus oceanibius TaxID=2707525 RepID=A0A6B3LGF6_9BACT|nr:nuclease-related domain-containing protein [Sulfuriroseicoccus oceanibius]QQL45735.1 NERD domain-containing protein [Sulfuriroseicoccus oceanibius]
MFPILAKYFAILLFIAIPTAAVIIVFRTMRDRRARRTMFPKGRDERIAKPPGWSLRERVDELREKLDFWIMLIVAIPVTIGMLHLYNQIPFILALAFIFLLSLVATLRMVPLVIKIRNHRLGLFGEEIVGGILARLWGNGCAVFHDLQTTKIGNIDHVVVGPTGVYVIETKCRRRKREQEGHRVVFDRTKLESTSFSDSHGLEQAERNAHWLSEQLTKLTAEPVACKAVLTLPGWFVSERKLGPVRVLHPKQIERYITSQPASLSQEQQQRISNWLEERCQLEVE